MNIISVGGKDKHWEERKDCTKLLLDFGYCSCMIKIYGKGIVSKAKANFGLCKQEDRGERFGPNANGNR